MKNKLLIILALVLFAGCGEKTQEQKNDPNNLSYNMVSYRTEAIDDTSTRVYAIIENTSENSGNIDYLTYAILDADFNSLYKGEMKYNEKFNSGEQKLIIFEVPVNIEKIGSAYITPFYKNKKPISVVDKQHEYDQVQTTIEEIKKSKDEVSVEISFNEKTKIKNLKVTVYNANSYPICITNFKINEEVKPDKKYTYKFKCDMSIDNGDYIVFEK